MGRLCTYTADIAETIIDRLSSGEPLEEICRDEQMPASRTVHDWIHPDKKPVDVPSSFAADFAQARARGEEAIAAECLAIADDGRNDWITRMAANGDEGALAYSAEHVQRSKLRVETRLKLLAKWNPKKWGEKIDMTSDGKTMAVTPQFNITLTKE